MFFEEGRGIIIVVLLGWWELSSKRQDIVQVSGFRINMCMLDEIRAKRDEIYAIARAHKAEKLWVFGSCARKEAEEV